MSDFPSFLFSFDVDVGINVVVVAVTVSVAEVVVVDNAVAAAAVTEVDGDETNSPISPASFTISSWDRSFSSKAGSEKV